MIPGCLCWPETTSNSSSFSLAFFQHLTKAGKWLQPHKQHSSRALEWNIIKKPNLHYPSINLGSNCLPPPNGLLCMPEKLEFHSQYNWNVSSHFSISQEVSSSVNIRHKKKARERGKFSENLCILFWHSSEDGKIIVIQWEGKWKASVIFHDTKFSRGNMNRRRSMKVAQFNKLAFITHTTQTILMKLRRKCCASLLSLSFFYLKNYRPSPSRAP